LWVSYFKGLLFRKIASQNIFHDVISVYPSNPILTELNFKLKNFCLCLKRWKMRFLTRVYSSV